tara:strand:+ start:3741 stop:4247 length:507 start_codon:yes stop_codon:yes gene_type:complete
MTYQILSSSTFHENFKIIYEDSPTKQSLTNSYVEVPLSYINYKPSPGSSCVIYQFSFHVFADSGENERNLFVKFQYSNDNGSSWSDWGDNTECFLGSAAFDLRMKTSIDLKWALNTSGWNSNKTLRIVAKEDPGSDTALHQDNDDFLDESSSYSNQFYNPSVSCYSVE